jgi:hypothetical protein
MSTDPRTIAARLGLDVHEVRGLLARGYLLTLPIDTATVRRRLHRAHEAFARGSRNAGTVNRDR